MKLAPSYSKWATSAHFFISVSAFLLSACGGQIEGDFDAEPAADGVRRDVVTRGEPETTEEEFEVWLSNDQVEAPHESPTPGPEEGHATDWASCECEAADFGITLRSPTGTVVYDLPPEADQLPISCDEPTLHLDPCSGFTIAACHETLGCLTLHRAANDEGPHFLAASLNGQEAAHSWHGHFALGFDESSRIWSGEFSFTDPESGAFYDGHFTACPSSRPTHCRAP